MNELQKNRVAAIGKVRRADVSHENQFMATMEYIAKHDHHRWLSAKQNNYLEKICFKYREQLTALGFAGLVPKSPLTPLPKS